MSYAPLPTASQVVVTRQLISNTKSAIAAAVEQIQDYEALIADLRTKILGFRQEIVVREAYLAPVRRLPFEVLGEIVTLRATDPDAPVQVLRDFASICKTWRDAALRTPKAWTKIDIHLTSKSNFKYLHHRLDISEPRIQLGSVRDVQEWYERSGCCEKDVSLNYDETTDNLRPVIDLIVSRASELRSLASQTCNIELLSCAMPNLESLGMSTFRLDDNLMSALVRSSPRLSCLRLNACGPEVDGLLGYARTRLESLVIDKIAPRSFFRVLRADGGFVNLLALNVSFDRYTMEPPISDWSTVSLPRLRAIFLSMNDIMVSVLETLHLPLLESLALRTDGYSTNRPTTKEVAALLSFPGDGDLQLRELRLENLWISDADLLRLLKRMPRLELLAIVNGKTSDKVMSALMSKQKGRPSRWLCPDLSRICIIADSSWKSDKFKVSQAGMNAFIKARLRANHTALEGPPPPVARLINVRLDDDDVVFHGVLSLDWKWKQDEHPMVYLTHQIKPSDVSWYGSRWWYFSSQWHWQQS